MCSFSDLVEAQGNMDIVVTRVTFLVTEKQICNLLATAFPVPNKVAADSSSKAVRDNLNSRPQPLTSRK